jgi:hypothetical protein
MIARSISQSLVAAWQQFPAVVLTGARQTGKTTLVRELWPAASYVSLDRPEKAAVATESPEAFLRELVEPAVIDEAQYAPGLFRHLKLLIDADRRPGRFLLTGSQTFSLMQGVSESLAGRCAVFSLGTLSARELGTGPERAAADALLWRGGYPELWAHPDLSRDLWIGSYVATYLERDVRSALAVGSLRDFDRFLRLAALRCGQLLNFAELARDAGIAPNTAKAWLSVLNASGVIFLLEPWFRQRNKRLIKTPKLYFSDTGLLTGLLGFRSVADLQQHPLWGAVWENWVVAEVRKTFATQPRSSGLWAWRTVHGEEVDLLVETAPERFAAIECKVAAQVDGTARRGLDGFRAEMGSEAVRAAFIACRTETAYPLPGSDVWAVPVCGNEGLLHRLDGLLG